ncbi:hypothetical protein KY342_00440 [Candidatus Woesearchaeota archaeon]|nr:hypothetical protein [Candidatus Woesearchaeota archaeon]
MAKGAEKQRRKAMFKAEQARREKQAATKERLLREQALRRARELAGGGPSRPLSKLAAKEAEIKAKQAAQTQPKQVAPVATGPSRLSRVGSGLKSIGSGVGGFVAGRLTSKGEESSSGPSGTPKVGLGWLFLFLSGLLYIFIDWRFNYNGIDIGFFFDMNNIDWLFKTGILMVLGVILAFQFILFKPKDNEEKKAAIFLDVVLAVVFILAQYNHGALYHAIFVLCMWLILIRPVMDKKSAYWTLSALILIDFVGINALGRLFEITGVSNVALSYMVIPVFSLYLLYYIGVLGNSKLATAMLLIIVILYFSGFVKNSVQYEILAAELDVKQKEEAWSFWRTSITRFREGVGILWDPIVCSSFIARPGEHEECLRGRQIARLCSDKFGTKEYNQCLSEKQGLDIGGATDKTIKEFTKVEFKKPEEFPKQIQKDFVPSIPMQLNIESTKKPVSVKLSCKFKTTGSEIQGITQPERIDKVTGTKKYTILCEKPSGEEFIEGRFYTVVYEAEIEGIETESTLTRLFVGKELDEAEKTKLLSLHSLSIKEPSKSAEEFAAFSFGIGTPPSNPFINDYPTQVIIGNIENLAAGKILSVDNIEVELIDGVTPTEGCSRAFTRVGDSLVLKPEAQIKLQNLQLTKGGKRFLLGCNLDIASYLAETEDYVKRGFSSKMTYSYTIKKEERFSVAKIPSLV